MVDKRTQDILSNFTEDSVLAIYLTGSRNNNLHTEASDYDYVVIKRPTVDSLLGRLPKPKHTTGEDCDYRTYDLIYFLNRAIIESIHNDAEVLWNDPVYCHEDYKEIKETLDNNKETLINKERILSSILGCLNGIYHKVSNTSGKVDLERVKFNKELANFFRYEVQMKKIVEENNFYVNFEKDFRKRFLEIKETYPRRADTKEAQEILEKENLKERLEHLVQLNKNYKEKETQKDDIKKDLINKILEIV